MKHDWLLYAGALTVILTAATLWHEDSTAPAAPPPPGVGEMSLFANFTPFGTSTIMNLPPETRVRFTGTTFSLSGRGEWVVAKQAVQGCQHPFINIGGNLGVPVEMRPIPRAPNYLRAVTVGGARAMQHTDLATIEPGMRGFMPGYPGGTVGEATARLIGKTELRPRKRMLKGETVLAWAKAGQTEDLRGGLNRLMGGPALDASSHVIGITLTEKPRRGRIYTSTPETLAAVGRTVDHRNDFEREDTMTRYNYGVVSDTLRREYRVAQVGCIRS